MKLFPPHLCDFYKTGHIFQYPEGITQVYSNLTPRSASHFTTNKDGFDDKAVFLGLQGVIKWFLQDLWNKNFFQQPLHEVMSKYKSRMDSSLGPGMNLDHIKALWHLGYLPIEIMALPEGTKVPMRVPMLTIKNTEPEFYWIVNYLETALSAALWKTSTVATVAHQLRKLADEYAEKTSSQLWFVDWCMHDFSFRGMSGIHDASSSNIGHLLSFSGTDTIPAIDYLENYYGFSKDLVFGSIPASEHSTVTYNILNIKEELEANGEWNGIRMEDL